ncbi:MAG: hypothetical protein EOO46_00205 [Flavobacterium sp.]|nr:MAG: hypothetical protein EOO46_00205 [Flavobacterium sp.]
MENFNIVVIFKGREICFTVREIGKRDYLIAHKGELLGNLLLDSRFEPWGSISCSDIADKSAVAERHGFNLGIGRIILEKHVSKGIADQIMNRQLSGSSSIYDI